MSNDMKTALCPLVSIIVPVYNVNEYLIRCLSSLTQQEYHNIEIILIDDGSIDFSGFKTDLALDSFENIVVIHKLNGGLSSARNAGLELASGDYILFVDSDDWIDISTVRKTIGFALENESDIVIFDFAKVYSDGYSKIDHKLLDSSNYWTQDTFWSYYYSEYNYICCVCWNKLYKKDLLNSIRFRNNAIHEDEFILYDIIKNTKSISFLNLPLYFYFQRNESIMHKWNAKSSIDAIDANLYRAIKAFTDKEYHLSISSILSVSNVYYDVYKTYGIKLFKSESYMHRQTIINVLSFQLLKKTNSFKQKIKLLLGLFPNVYIWIMGFYSLTD